MKWQKKRMLNFWVDSFRPCLKLFDLFKQQSLFSKNLEELCIQLKKNFFLSSLNSKKSWWRSQNDAERKKKKILFTALIFLRNRDSRTFLLVSFLDSFEFLFSVPRCENCEKGFRTPANKANVNEKASVYSHANHVGKLLAAFLKWITASYFFLSSFQDLTEDGFDKETTSGRLKKFLDFLSRDLENSRVSQKNMKIQKVDLHRLFRVFYDPISLCMAKLNWFISHYLALKILCFILETTKFKHFILS